MSTITYNNFEDFFKEQLLIHPIYTAKNKHTQESYRGIIRSHYPKWLGWHVIKREKINGIRVHQIQCAELDSLVKNFYFIQYLDNK